MVGVLACCWGIVAIGMGFFIVLQFLFIVPYAIGLMGALSVRPAREPRPVAPEGS
jgi:Na+-transporting methylmalonyl-CoA/oxaloacetate decarboxylase gamma subunit